MKAKRIVWIAVMLVVVLFVFRIAGRITSSNKIVSEKSIPVEVKSPVIGPIEEKVTLTGDIKADKEVSVRPRIAGRVAEIYADEGDKVEKGAALLSYIAGINPDNELYDDMVVIAPISGIIGMKLIKEGDQVMNQVGGGVNPVFVIYDIGKVKVYADIPEKYYSSLDTGMPAQIFLDAYPDEVFRGSINKIRPVVDPMSRTTQVEIVLPNKSHRIKPGMFVKVDIPLRKTANAVIVPFDSVLGDREKYVFVSENSVAKMRPVVLGLQQENKVQIKEGVAASDKVIVSGQRIVKDGSKIEEIKE
ncbi:MAG: efflux RND transporter periplasmic adaptor subunit [Candidatus Margulisiibacteriota bacterium]